ncbi:UDP-2,3-diacylglucosamine diphosphatase [Sunxiuqinia elliptica]|uniref:UDP-2,3-diacylglucosamine hydrolase n=1 Tax=Sunxiuqinia elliptica TaxID=655355 RepID=A0A1I2EV58_9BACT|nr:UDP-2,3-diacylglucosamine diphosphatase [Sunxiuqinia elliptica]SFE96689.1 UDP-2,3-diacylglucosamine hydrolase [Sunxiuqinia elliptica]
MTDYQGKIYFISDTHLGAPALSNNLEREKLLVRWLDEIKQDAAALFLMGDIFDYWFEYKTVAPRGFTRFLGKLAELSDSGIPIHFFTGNHDVWVFDYLPKEIGFQLHREEMRVTLSGKKFFLAHGDGLDPYDKGYHFLKKLFTNRFLQWLNSWLHPDVGIRLAHAWSKKSRLSKGMFVPFKGEDAEGLYLFAKSVLEQEEVDYFIFGHRHLLLDLPLGKKSRYINLGDWITHFSYGVFDGNKFELKTYKGPGEKPKN